MRTWLCVAGILGLALGACASDEGGDSPPLQDEGAAADTSGGGTVADPGPSGTTDPDPGPTDLPPTNTGEGVTEPDTGLPACLAEGESRPVVPNAPDCCEGLEPIGCEAPNGEGVCLAEPCVGAMICADCGNGTCGPGENVCNCPADCTGEEPPECVAEGESKAVVPDAPECCEGLQPISCGGPAEDGSCDTPCVGASICAKCGDGTCGTGENKCNCPADCAEGDQCVAEGGSRPVVPNAPECCEGLEPIDCDAPGEDGTCPETPCLGATFCAKCGDGTCGSGENKCNCVEDCGDEPSCVTEGGSRPVVPGAPECCEGLEPISCHAPAGDGSCDTPCVGASICAKCGDGSCGPGENKCNCELDCAEEAACVAEGESRPVVPDAPDCCDGLVLIGCDAPAQDGTCPTEPCLGASVCADCPNGTCGPGENKCNCAADCTE